MTRRITVTKKELEEQAISAAVPKTVKAVKDALTAPGSKGSDALNRVIGAVDYNSRAVYNASLKTEPSKVRLAAWRSAGPRLDLLLEKEPPELEAQVDAANWEGYYGRTNVATKTALKAIALDLADGGYDASYDDDVHASADFKDAVEKKAQELGLGRKRKAIDRFAAAANDLEEFNKYMDDPDVQYLVKKNEVPEWGKVGDFRLADKYAIKTKGVSAQAKEWRRLVDSTYVNKKGETGRRGSGSIISPDAPTVAGLLTGDYNRY